MLSPEIIRRIRNLNRQDLPKTTCPANFDIRSPSNGRLFSTFELPAGREIENSSGKHWLIEQPLSELCPATHASVTSRSFRWQDKKRELHAELDALQNGFPQATMFLDLETCGFAGSMVFLVGLLLHQHPDLVICQLLARNYSEEKAMFQTLWELLEERSVLVTFNGKSFDWPVVKDRSILHQLATTIQPLQRLTEISQLNRTANHGVSDPDPLIHCDLLHHARRLWKNRLPNCKLQTLEKYVCGRHRRGDIPGRDIPAAYHNYVRTGDAWQLGAVLHHNSLDLVTLLELSVAVIDRESVRSKAS